MTLVTLSNGKKTGLSVAVRECLDEPGKASGEAAIAGVEHKRFM